MRLPIFCGLKETLRCGSRLGGSRSARRRMPPYLGFSPVAGAWAKASDPPLAARDTSRLIIAAVRTTLPSMPSGRCMRTIRHLLSDIALAYLSPSLLPSALSQYHRNQLVHFGDRVRISQALCKSRATGLACHLQVVYADATTKPGHDFHVSLSRDNNRGVPSMQYDVLLSGGRVIDPAQGIDGALDVAIQDGRVAAVQAAIPREHAREVLDVSGKLVLPGLIDTHAHVYQYVTGRFGLNADMVGVHSGVTALIDQGGPSCMTLPGFRQFIVEPARSRVYAFLSAYLVGGLEGHAYPSLYRPDCLDVEATVRAAKENADLVKGIKAHAELGGFARWGIEVMRLAARIGQEADLPVYIHFGQLWPVPETGANNVDADDILPQVVELLKPGDILAHPSTRHPGGF